jgi:predicted transposase YbfD/YdcC
MSFIDVVGSGFKVNTGESEYTLSPLTGADVGSLVTSHALKTRKAIERVLKEQKADIKTCVEVLANHDYVANRFDRVFDIVTTVEGACDLVLMSLSKKHPDVTIDELKTWNAMLIYDTALKLVRYEPEAEPEKNS